MPDELVAAIPASAAERDGECEAYYYAGERCRLQGDDEQARGWYRKCAEMKMPLDVSQTPPDPMNEYHLAVWRLGE